MKLFKGTIKRIRNNEIMQKYKYFILFILIIPFVCSLLYGLFQLIFKKKSDKIKQFGRNYNIILKVITVVPFVYDFVFSFIVSVIKYSKILYFKIKELLKASKDTKFNQNEAKRRIKLNKLSPEKQTIAIKKYEDKLAKKQAADVKKTERIEAKQKAKAVKLAEKLEAQKNKKKNAKEKFGKLKDHFNKRKNKDLVIFFETFKPFFKFILILPVIFEFISYLKYKTQRKVWGIIFLTPWALGFILFFLKPLIETFIFSFQKVTPSSSGLEIANVGFNNYYRALREHVSFATTLIGSTQTTVINLPVILIFSLLIAVVLNARFKGRTFVRAVFFIPVIFNSAAVASALGGGEALRNVMEQNGLGIMDAFDFESYLLEANIGTGLVTFLTGSIDRIYTIVTLSGVQILIFLAGIQSIPGHLYEAAKIEGATSYEIFWKITLPMVSPMIITATVYTIVDTFVRSPITNIIRGTGIDYGLNAAMSWIYFGTSALLLAIVLGILSKVVFYYED